MAGAWTRSIVCAVVLAGCSAFALSAEAPVAADRTPLTFRDSGLYANLGCIDSVDPTRDGVANLLTAERAARPDTPWDFFIMQYNAAAPDAAKAERLKMLASRRKKIILRVHLGKEKHKLDLERAKRRLDDLFKHTDPKWLYAITLDEENVYWHGNTSTLTALYAYAKKRWPDLPVYQWWTPMIAPDVHAAQGWVALPADGWVMDLYGRRGDEFEKKLLKFLETGKPLVHIAWASPTWIFYEREGCTTDDWWEKAGRAVLDEQLRVCREYNVPVAYFCTQPAKVKDGKRVAPIRWGWRAVDPVVRRWFHELEVLAANLDYLPGAAIGFRQPTPRKFAWAHARPGVRVKLTLEGDRPRFSWRSELGDADASAGEHELPCPYSNPYVRLSYRMPESSGPAHEGFALRSVDRRTAATPIVFRVRPLAPVTDWRVSATVKVVKALGGAAGLAWSRDGATWSDEVRADPEQTRPQAIEVHGGALAQVRGAAPLFVRVTLYARAGRRTNVASRLQAIEVCASLAPSR